MRISSTNSINFGRALTTQERQHADQVKKEAMELLDIDKIIAIIPEASFPSETKKDIGVGQLNSKYNGKFLDFMKTYTGANSIKVLPPGEYVKNSQGFYCNYATSALTLGTHSINLEELTEEKMGSILSKETLNKVYETAVKPENINTANFENVVGATSPHGLALKEAYDGFIKSTSPEVAALKEEFNKYKLENHEFIEKRALFESLTEEYKTDDINKWADYDKNLFNKNIVSNEVREGRIKELNQKYSEKIDFIFFEQYLADKNLEQARKEMNDKGIKLTGDCLVAFSPDEIWSHPQAFEDASICSKDWGLRALNYSNILEENSESNQLLRQKVRQFAKRYDNIRFDVGWSYINPVFYPNNSSIDSFKDRYNFDEATGGYRVKEPLGDRLINIIENTVKEVKGDTYKQENLLYEIEAGPKDFTAFDWNAYKVIDALKNRTIIQSTMYMNDNYATVDFLEHKMKIPRDNYIIMAGNHDHLALNALANGIDSEKVVSSTGNDINQILENQYKPLARGLKLDENLIKNSPEEFTKAKFAYNFLGKNTKLFFMDIFGRQEQFDAQNNNTSKNYRQRISSNYEEEFHKSIQDKKGLNIMDALAKAMKAKGLDKTNRALYNELKSYSETLYEKGALTEEEANKTLLSNTKTKLSTSKKIMAGIAALCVIGGITYYSKQNKNKHD